MKVSLDASAIIPLFIGDAFIDRIEAYLAMHAPALIVSDFAAAEFTPSPDERIRTRELLKRLAAG